MPSQAEQIAREAKAQAEGLRIEFDILSNNLKEINLAHLRERAALIEERLTRIEKQLEELKHVPVLEDRVNKLEKHKDESEKRGWQFVFIGVGAACAVVGGVVVQLVARLLKT